MFTKNKILYTKRRIKRFRRTPSHFLLVCPPTSIDGRTFSRQIAIRVVHARIGRMLPIGMRIISDIYILLGAVIITTQ